MDFIDDESLVKLALASARDTLMRGEGEKEAVEAAKAVVAAAVAAEAAISAARKSD